MKKFLFLVFTIFLSTNFAFSYETHYYKTGKFESMVQKVGFELLNANRIPYHTNFFVLTKENNVNAYTTMTQRNIFVYKNLFAYINSEDELAAILAHEISHVVESNQGIFKGTFTKLSHNLAPRKYEYKADKRGVDYMVKAGYNPVAMIVVLNKLGGQPRYEIFSSHPLTTRRMSEIYEYIYLKYPEYLVNNKFKDDIVYQNFLLISKENRKKLQQKVQSKSTKSIRYE